jgi:hypothetical protein
LSSGNLPIPGAGLNERLTGSEAAARLLPGRIGGDGFQWQNMQAYGTTQPG